jgi:hypothetical protein
MKTFLVEYQVTKRKKTRGYSCTVEAETMALAKQAIVRKGGKVQRASRIA